MHEVFYLKLDFYLKKHIYKDYVFIFFAIKIQKTQVK
jgi:hypothetical protein